MKNFFCCLFAIELTIGLTSPLRGQIRSDSIPTPLVNRSESYVGLPQSSSNTTEFDNWGLLGLLVAIGLASFFPPKRPEKEASCKLENEADHSFQITGINAEKFD
jgi:hypothetical protein